MRFAFKIVVSLIIIDFPGSNYYNAYQANSSKQTYYKNKIICV